MSSACLCCPCAAPPPLPAASGAEGRLSGNVGAIRVAELDWADPRHLAALSPPYDLVLAADCIYHETLLRDLYRVMLALTSERSTGEGREGGGAGGGLEQVSTSPHKPCAWSPVAHHPMPFTTTPPFCLAPTHTPHLPSPP